MRELERAKYEKMFELVPDYGRTGFRFKAEIGKRCQRSERILDCGSGNGSIAKCLRQAGFKDISVMDIAKNAGCMGIGFPQYVHCIWDEPYPWSGDTIICLDVMEHIPPGCVEKVFEIHSKIAKKVFYHIAFAGDCSGPQTIGEELHITIRPEDWWVRLLDKYFQRREPLPPKWGGAGNSWVCWT